MLTYSFENRGSDSLYEHLYKSIKADILAFRLSPDEKLPSKRALAKHLNVSTVTVEGAYGQLLAEGYIYSRPKSGYYVSKISNSLSSDRVEAAVSHSEEETPIFADFAGGHADQSSFPFNIWARLMRETMSVSPEKLMVRSPSAGIDELREAIAEHLYSFRGMRVRPGQIVVGAGTEYLYGLIIQLLGRDKLYAVEDPGYRKISRIYAANEVDCAFIPMDESGVSPEALVKSGADVLHISPSHHFPSGIVTPVSRRYELLSWVCSGPDRYIIEDDYDSELRLLGKPIPPLQSIDAMGKVIYINTFSKSLSSTIRISYMVLPEALMEEYTRSLSFYSCTVSNFDQYTLAAFIRGGHLEKHINRMRNHYRSRRDELIACIRSHKHYSRVSIREEDAGLHFLLELDTPLSDDEIVSRSLDAGIRVSCLSEYYHHNPGKSRTLLINYAGLSPEKTEEAVSRLFGAIWS
ncbi:MAG: PLP-dependent aminotransferase family protein [Oscillospiraceae bacterium]|nr:PLP-dependent aminotransferase family protein [Oscillospiraceae bacterium]